MIHRFIFGLAIGAMACGATSAVAADAANGLRIAERWCAACHVVSSDQTRGSADVPSFASIAHRKPDARALANFIAEPHPKMPSMSLSRDEIADIVRYIQTLDPATSAPTPIEKDNPPGEPRRG